MRFATELKTHIVQWANARRPHVPASSICDARFRHPDSPRQLDTVPTSFVSHRANDGWDQFSLRIDDVEKLYETANSFSLISFDQGLWHFFRPAASWFIISLHSA